MRNGKIRKDPEPNSRPQKDRDKSNVYLAEERPRHEQRIFVLSAMKVSRDLALLYNSLIPKNYREAQKLKNFTDY